MKTEEIIVLFEKIPGLQQALAAEFGRSIPLKGLTFERKPIDTHVLSHTLRESKEGFDQDGNGHMTSWQHRCESLYVVYEDGSLKKSEHVEYRAVGTSENPWIGESSSHDIYWENNDEEILPVAHLFTLDRAVRHVILIASKAKLSGGKRRIESIAITVHQIQSDTITLATQLMKLFWEYGEIHPDDLEELQ